MASSDWRITAGALCAHTVTHFFDLQKVEEGVCLSGGNQSGLFPTRQLTRREPQDAKQIFSPVSVHGYYTVLLSLLCGNALWEASAKEGREGI